VKMAGETQMRKDMKGLHSKAPGPGRFSVLPHGGREVLGRLAVAADVQMVMAGVA